MPVFETARGVRMEVTLPRPGWKELEEAVDAYEKLKQERKVTGARLGELTRKREQAIEADRRALAKAIREGKRDPGGKAVEQIEKEIKACNRRLEALEEALDDAESDLAAVVEEHRKEWSEEAEAEFLEAREEYAAAVEALNEARAVFAERRQLLAWVRRFPDEQTGSLSFRVRDSYLPRLSAPSVDPYTFSTVVEALREAAQVDASRVAGDPSARGAQRIHEERKANQEAGRGYWTDAELVRLAEDPVAFLHGAGAERQPRRRSPRPVNTPAGLFVPPADESDEEE